MIILPMVAAVGVAQAQPRQDEVFKPYTRVRVLAIGVNHTRHFEPVSADLDAKNIADVLNNHYGYEVLAVITGVKARRSDILAAFRQALQESGPDDVLILFWAGHGHFVVPQVSPQVRTMRAEAFLVTADTNLNEDDKDLTAWGSQAVNMEELASMSLSAKARHVVLIVDACYSGMVRSRGAVENKRIQKRAPSYVRRLLNGRSRFVLTAGRSRETVVNTKNGGLFSLELVRELKQAQEPLGLYELRARLQRTVDERIDREGLTQEVRDGRADPTKRQRAVMTPSGSELLLRRGEEPGEFFFLPAAFQRAVPDPEKQTAAMQRKSGGKQVPSTQYTASRGAQAPSSSQEWLNHVLTVSPPRFTKNATQGLEQWKDILNALKDEAAMGDPVAMAALSHAYAKGFSGEVEAVEAFDWAWQSAIENEHPAGLYALGVAMRDGVGTERNAIAGQTLIEEAANAGDSAAITERRGSAVHRLQEAAVAGYAPAKLLLAQLALEPLRAGRSLGQMMRGPTREQALQLAHEAAAAGYAPAMMTLYRWSLRAYAGRADAGVWLQQAAAAGDLEGQLTLARALRGIPRRAQMFGVYKPHPSVPVMFSEETAPLNVAGLRPDPQAAYIWAKSASERQLPQSFVLLAELADPDAPTMIELLNKAVALGYAEALALESVWRIHEILPQNPQRSFALAREAADKDVALGYWTLGLCYASGVGTRVDQVSALHWFIESLKAGWPEARPHIQELLDKNVDLGRRTATPEWRRIVEALHTRYRGSAIELELQFRGATAGVVTIER